MFREAAQIALAISFSANKLPQVQVKQYADVMQKQAVQIGIDPLLFVAVASHEKFHKRASHFQGLSRLRSPPNPSQECRR